MSRSSSGNTGDEEKANFKNILTLPFHRTEKDNYQARVLLVNGYPYVGFSRLGYSEKRKQFIYTKKNMFMPVPVWRNFAQKYHLMERKINETLNSGISTHRVIFIFKRFKSTIQDF